MNTKQPISTFLGIAAAVVLAANSYAADIFVPGGEPTIQAGINAANPGDVVIVAEGEYFENINFFGKAITVRSTDPNDAGVVLNTIINGGGSGSVVTCTSGEGPDTVLEGFTIIGGTGTLFELVPGFFLLVGGGMFNNVSSPTVTNCTFSSNTATNGGGMRNISSSPTVSNCTFSGNSAGTSGGGMNNHPFSSPTVTNCSFSGNSADFDGGGMYNHGLSNPMVSNCTFSGNSANVRGGGMFNLLSSSPTVSNCSFTGNSAANGGGMGNGSGSDPMVTNCTFSGNSATSIAGGGGGMGNFTISSPTVTNCTFSSNTATNGGGMRNISGSNPTVTNCVLWGDSPNEFSGPGTPAVAYSDVQGGFGGTGNINTDPQFVDANGPDNIAGTGDDDLRLQPGSPCIDAADKGGCGDCEEPNPDDLPGCSDSVCEGIVCDAVPLCCDIAWDALCASVAAFICDCVVLPDIATDLDGNPRFVDDPDTPDCQQAPGTCGDPPVVDMGAYEFQAAPTCPWDLNGDGVVNVLDLIELVMSFGPCEGCPADINDDGIVNVLDLLTLLLSFGPCPSTPCVWDVNGDGIVDQADLDQVVQNMGPCDGCPEDINGDGVVNGQDAAAVATHFGPCP